MTADRASRANPPALLPSTAPQLIALVGAPATGKSTAAAGIAAFREPAAVVLSLAELRVLVSPYRDPADQEATPAAVQRLHREVAAYLRNGRSVVVDAPNATPDARAMLLEIAHTHGALTVAVVFVVPLTVARRRNRDRSPEPGPSGYAEQVPDDLLAGCVVAINSAVPNLPAEGWHAVVIRT